MASVNRCIHFSCLTTYRVWVSDKKNLILANVRGVPIYCLNDKHCGYGIHTVSGNNDLIYIDIENRIKKLSHDMKTISTFLDITISVWKPQCVFWSSSKRSLLVGMYREDKFKGKVTRYNQTAQLTQTIQHDKNGMGLYKKPIYITENNNGDVVVSDHWSCAVVVTEQGGSHRFSYTGHPTGSVLWPRGICTDTMSHILVCDLRTDTIHMLNMDGYFLSHLFIKPDGHSLPYCLNFDASTHRLWVGSYNSVFVYNYISRDGVPLGRSDYLLLLKRVNDILLNFIYNNISMR